MQHTTGVAVLTTQLAAVDRRALSQAWYSALHLAGRPPRPPARAAQGSSRERHGVRAAAHESTRRDAAGDTGSAIRSRGSAVSVTRRAAGANALERRMPASELARRIERGLLGRRPRGVPASFTVRAADGRVQLLVRGDGARTRVVAVCTAALRERVDRALGHARFALAASGVRAEVA